MNNSGGDGVRQPHLRDPEEKFLTRTRVAGECLEWVGGLDREGYGRIWTGQKQIAAHRYAWVRRHGHIPPGLCVLHTCDNRECVNIEHLELGTEVDKAQRRISRGRDHQAAKTHCPKGHEYNQENTYFYKDKKRNCRACNRAAQKKRLAK